MSKITRRLIGRNSSYERTSKSNYRYMRKQLGKTNNVEKDIVKGYVCPGKKLKYIIMTESGPVISNKCKYHHEIPAGARPYFGSKLNEKISSSKVLWRKNKNNEVFGRTSKNAGHTHNFTIHNDMSVTISIARHPGNNKVAHRHEYVGKYPTGRVVSNHSSCYPRCKDQYGVSGAKPHIHKLLTDEINNIGY